jgi:hypothetical protein
MGGPRHDGIPGWVSPDDEPPTRRPATATASRAPYLRSTGWAIVAWIVALGIVYLVSQVLGLPQLGGWIGLAGFVIGSWFGGIMGGITGTRDWASFVVILLGIAFILVGLGSCAAAMALYG